MKHAAEPLNESLPAPKACQGISLGACPQEWGDMTMQALKERRKSLSGSLRVFPTPRQGWLGLDRRGCPGSRPWAIFQDPVGVSLSAKGDSGQ